MSLRERIEKLAAEWLEAEKSGPAHWEASSSTAHQVMGSCGDALRAALAQPEAPSADPVAWQHRDLTRAFILDHDRAEAIQSGSDYQRSEQRGLVLALASRSRQPAARLRSAA